MFKPSCATPAADFGSGVAREATNRRPPRNCARGHTDRQVTPTVALISNATLGKFHPLSRLCSVQVGRGGALADSQEGEDLARDNP